MTDHNRKSRMKRAEIESEIAQTVSRFSKDLFGRGPLRIRAHWIDDVVLVALFRPLHGV